MSDQEHAPRVTLKDDTHVNLSFTGDYYSNIHRPTLLHRLAATPNERLEELAEKWESSGMVEDEACAMELREVMEAYSDD